MQRRTFAGLCLSFVICISAVIGGIFLLDTVDSPEPPYDALSTHLQLVEATLLSAQGRYAAANNNTRNEGLAHAMQLSHLLDGDVFPSEDELKNLAQQLGVTLIRIGDADGSIIVSSHNVPMTGAIGDLNTQQFQQLFEQRTTYVSVFGRPQGNLVQYFGAYLPKLNAVFSVARPVPFLGNMSADSDIRNVLAQFVSADGGYVFAVDINTGKIVAHPNSNFIGRAMWEDLSDYGELLIDREEMHYSADIMGDWLLVAVSPVVTNSSFMTIIALCLVALGGILASLLSYVLVTGFWQSHFGNDLKSINQLVSRAVRGEFEIENDAPVFDVPAVKMKDFKSLSENVVRLVEAVYLIAHESEDVKVVSTTQSEAKSAFLANMSHEIRTPLNAIIGFAELALEDSVSEATTRDYLRKIKTSSDGLLEVINDVLDISKIESGKMEIENVEFDLREIIDSVHVVLMPKAEQKGISFANMIDDRLISTIMGDPTKLRQVLINLASNAVKFTNEGVVKMITEVKYVKKNRAVLRFEVTDTGIGMTEAQVAKIFSPFQQADSSTSRNFGGTGLGLSISKQMVEKMGGELLVDSMPNVGTKFSFELSVEWTNNAVMLERAGKKSPIERPKFEGEILVVEDNDINQDVIRDHLALVGVKCTMAINGQEGIDEWQRRERSGESPYSLIFMDINMPVMDGVEATKQLVSMGCSVPIIALTANVIRENDTMYDGVGFVGFMSKPFRKEDLWSCLSQYMRSANPKVENKKSIAKVPQIEVDLDPDMALLIKFAQRNRNVYRDINTAVTNGDVKTAHRLAHTLKGLAAMIERPALQKAALAVETGLERGKIEVRQEQLDALKEALAVVISDIDRKRGVAISFDKHAVAKTLDELEPLLAADDMRSADFISQLQRFPETRVLVQQIEQCDFEAALVTLSTVRELLEV